MNDMQPSELLQEKIKIFRTCRHFHATWMSSLANSNLQLEDVPNIINTFHFIGINNRSDESLLALRYLLNISLCDILYVRAKDSNSDLPDDKGFKLIPHPKLHEEDLLLQQYVVNEYQQHELIDYEILRIANQRLDYIIDEIGQDKFITELAQYQNLLRVAEETCLPKNVSSVKYQSNMKCYVADQGCGYDCLDNLCSTLIK
jgi:hypothetical protein